MIELFGGIGSQAKALKNIGADFEHYKLVEFDEFPVTSYNAIHGTNFETQDITKINGADLGIVDTDKYNYIVTYSFPCQDLSVAGNQAGMTKGTGTRSGLLWEVERLLNECEELPQVLLMENVPQAHSKKNMPDFEKWISYLESKGYSNYWQDLNAKNYGIPQNRNRCFMVSALNNKEYQFPKPFELTLRLKDMLEDEVDEKFYLSDAQIERIETTTYVTGQRRVQTKDYCDTLCARDWKDPKCVQVANLSGGKWDKINESCRRVYSEEGISPTIHTCQGGNTEPKVEQKIICEQRCDEGLRFFKDNLCGSLRTIDSCGDKRVVEPDFRIRKLTPKECWRLMGFTDEDFEKAKTNLNETFYKGKDRSNSQLYKQAGNSIVVNVLEEIFKNILDILD